MADSDEQQVFVVRSKETVRRLYRVTAPSERDARQRMHLHWKDPAMLREGVVRELDEFETTHREIPKDEIRPTTEATEVSPPE